MTIVSDHAIENSFIGKLLSVELYGDPQEGLCKAITGRVHDCSDAQALAAAEQIIRTRGSGAFPKLPECLAALKTHKMAAGPSGLGSKITKDNFYSEALKFAPGRLIALNKIASPDDWREWMCYFEYIGLPWLPFHMRDLQTKEITVPTQSPLMFDNSWNGAAPRKIEFDEKSSDKRRAEIAALSRAKPMNGVRTAKEVERGVSLDKHQPAKPFTAAEHAAELARLKALNDEPFGLSQKLKSIVGL